LAVGAVGLAVAGVALARAPHLRLAGVLDGGSGGPWN
jgi:hypothetical protein